MSVRGEVTESIRRKGELRVREGSSYEEEGDYPSKGGVVQPARGWHPPTLFEPEAWQGRFGVRCGPAAPETKNP